MNMQPTLLNSIEHFANKMAMRVFVDTCEQYCYENKNFRYDVRIKEMYFDYGQDWKYTGFLTTDLDDATERSWQSFCPRDWELIVTTNDINKLIDMAWYYMEHLIEGDFDNLYEKFEG